MVDDNTYAYKTTADADGYYEFYPVDNGTYYVEAEYDGDLFTYIGDSDYFTIKNDDVVEIDITCE